MKISNNRIKVTSMKALAEFFLYFSLVILSCLTAGCTSEVDTIGGTPETPENPQANDPNRRSVVISLQNKLILVNGTPESRAITRQEEYADLLYKILLLELDEEEEESIELAELAYLGISECISSAPARIYECLKKRIILMHYFADYFTDSLIEVFLKKYRENNLLEARNLALESIERMQLFDIFLIEQNFDDRIDRDEQLTDVCNGIELAPNLTDEELTEAQLMHQVLYAYLKAKYRK